MFFLSCLRTHKLSLTVNPAIAADTMSAAELRDSIKGTIDITINQIAKFIDILYSYFVPFPPLDM